MVLAASAAEAAAIADRMGFPVVLKVVCLQPIAKLASGGVGLNLTSDAEVRTAYDQILSNVRQNGHMSRRVSRRMCVDLCEAAKIRDT